MFRELLGMGPRALQPTSRVRIVAVLHGMIFREENPPLLLCNCLGLGTKIAIIFTHCWLSVLFYAFCSVALRSTSRFGNSAFYLRIAP